MAIIIIITPPPVYYLFEHILFFISCFNRKYMNTGMRIVNQREILRHIYLDYMLLLNVLEQKTVIGA